MLRALCAAKPSAIRLPPATWAAAGRLTALGSELPPRRRRRRRRQGGTSGEQMLYPMLHLATSLSTSINRIYKQPFPRHPPSALLSGRDKACG